MRRCRVRRGWTDCPASFFGFTSVLRSEPGTHAKQTLASVFPLQPSLESASVRVPPSGIAVSSKAILSRNSAQPGDDLSVGAAHFTTYQRLVSWTASRASRNARVSLFIFLSHSSPTKQNKTQFRFLLGLLTRPPSSTWGARRPDRGGAGAGRAGCESQTPRR